MKNSIIPKPDLLELRDGVFTLKEPCTIFYSGNGAKEAALLLHEYLAPIIGVASAPAELQINDTTGIRLISLDSSSNEIFPSEEYDLSVDEEGIVLKASSREGLLRGIQTLRQLLPKEIYTANCQLREIAMQCLHIHDMPAMRWRGMMLDVARHFFDKHQVMHMIELFAQHKFNIVHLHLTDDQGWRVEIRQFPKLTQIGSIRKQTIIGHESSRPRKYDGIPYGGFFTQQELREIVAFADRRGITIVPEIDMPGHQSAAICAYPELGNSPLNHVEVRQEWGISSHILSPRESSIGFAKSVLAEIMEIFPSKFIHIGGDEAVKSEWEISPEAQYIMAKHNCRNEKELQDFFIGSICSFIRENGRYMIGWEEILNSGLDRGAVLASGRGRGTEKDALRQGTRVIMASRLFAYFDYYQADPASEPLAGGDVLPLEKVYSFNATEGIEPCFNSFVLGGQAQLWSEYIATLEHLEYMAFPRACALAEKLWTKPELCEYGDFLERMNMHRHRLDAQNVNYRHF